MTAPFDINLSMEARRVFDALGNKTWESLMVPSVSGNADVSVDYGGPAVEQGEHVVGVLPCQRLPAGQGNGRSRSGRERSNRSSRSRHSSSRMKRALRAKGNGGSGAESARSRGLTDISLGKLERLIR